MVVASLSRITQYAELDLTPFQGHIPTELFGQTPFAPVGDRPYALTLGAYAFYWLGLTKPDAERRVAVLDRKLQSLEVSNSWTSVFYGEAKRALNSLLLPASPADLQTLLDFYLLKRGASNLHFDLLNDPKRVEVPLLCLLQLLESDSGLDTSS